MALIPRLGTRFLLRTTAGSLGALSTNTGVTFLYRTLGGGTAPRALASNYKLGVLYVALTGTSAPAPGIIAINKSNLTNAFSPSTVTFTSGAPETLVVIP